MTAPASRGPGSAGIDTLGRAFLWILALGPVLVYLVSQLMLVSSLSVVPLDWLTYRYGANNVLAGQSPYAPWQLTGSYSFDAVAGGNGFVYPPSAAIILAPFLQPYALWVAFNVLVYLAGVLAVVVISAGLSPISVAVGLWIALIPPWLWDGILGGGVTPALAGALGLIYAGVPLTGVGAAIKLFPGAWVALPMRVDVKRALVGAAVGFGVPAAVSVAVAGLGPWADFVVAIRNARPVCDRALFSAVCLGVPQAVLWTAGAALFVLSFRLPRHWALLVLGLVPILAAPEIWLHYWLTIVPGMVAVAMTLGNGWSRGNRWSRGQRAVPVQRTS